MNMIRLVKNSNLTHNTDIMYLFTIFLDDHLFLLRNSEVRLFLFRK